MIFSYCLTNHRRGTTFSNKFGSTSKFYPSLSRHLLYMILLTQSRQSNGFITFWLRAICSRSLPKAGSGVRIRDSGSSQNVKTRLGYVRVSVYVLPRLKHVSFAVNWIIRVLKYTHIYKKAKHFYCQVRNRKNRVILIRNRVGTENRVSRKVGFKIIPTCQGHP